MCGAEFLNMLGMQVFSHTTDVEEPTSDNSLRELLSNIAEIEGPQKEIKRALDMAHDLIFEKQILSADDSVKPQLFKTFTLDGGDGSMGISNLIQGLKGLSELDMVKSDKKLSKLIIQIIDSLNNILSKNLELEGKNLNELQGVLVEINLYLNDKYEKEKAKRAKLETEIASREESLIEAKARAEKLKADLEDREKEPIEFELLRAAGYDLRVEGGENGEIKAWGQEWAVIKDEDSRKDIIDELKAVAASLRKENNTNYEGIKTPAGTLRTTVEALSTDDIKALMKNPVPGLNDASVENMSIPDAITKLAALKTAYTSPTKPNKAQMLRAGWKSEDITKAEKEYANEMMIHTERIANLSKLETLLKREAEQSEALYKSMSELVKAFKFAGSFGLDEVLPENWDGISNILSDISARRENFTHDDVFALLNAYEGLSGFISNKGNTSSLIQKLNATRMSIEAFGGDGDVVAENIRKTMIDLGYPEVEATERTVMIADSLKLDRTAIATGVDGEELAQIAEKATAPVTAAMQHAAFADLYKSGKFMIKRGGEFVTLDKLVGSADDLVSPDSLKKLVANFKLEESAAIYVIHELAAGGATSLQCHVIRDAMVDKILQHKGSDREGKNFSKTERIKRAYQAADAFITEQRDGPSIGHYFRDHQPELDRKEKGKSRRVAAKRELYRLESRSKEVKSRKHFDKLLKAWKKAPKEYRGERPTWLSYYVDRFEEGSGDWVKSALSTAAVEVGLKGSMRVAGKLANWGVRALTLGRFNPKAPSLIKKLTRFNIGKTFGWMHGKFRDSSDHTVGIKNLKKEIKKIDEEVNKDPNSIKIDGTQVDISSFFVAEKAKAA